MEKGDVLIRDKDKMTFEVIEVAHWSTIKKICFEETDRVKWIGGDQFVGSLGMYTRIKGAP